MKISRLLLALFFSAAASLLGNDELKERLQPALEAITPDGLLAHIKVLASDEFEGRSPGTKGEDLSVKYITDQFKKIGVKTGKSRRDIHAGSSPRRDQKRTANVLRHWRQNDGSEISG